MAIRGPLIVQEEGTSCTWLDAESLPDAERLLFFNHISWHLPVTRAAVRLLLSSQDITLIRIKNWIKVVIAMPEASNYRMAVEEWAETHPDIPVTFSFNEEGPEQNRSYQYIYLLGSTTEAEGERRSTKARAKESAAGNAIRILQNWNIPESYTTNRKEVKKWFGRRPKYNAGQTIALFSEPPYHERPVASRVFPRSETVPLVDPLRVLPNELSVNCILFVIQELPTGPLELLTVSRLWKAFLTSCPLFWANIFLENAEAEASRVRMFLHLSKGSPLRIHIRPILASSASLELLRPHRPRIEAISIMPGYHISIPNPPNYWKQWLQAASHMLMTLFDEVMPPDAENSYVELVRGSKEEYYITFVRFTLVSFPSERVRTGEHPRSWTDEESKKIASMKTWERHIQSTVEKVLPTSFNWDSSVENRGPLHVPDYKCTYSLRRFVGFETYVTQAEGDWSTSRAEASESAAAQAIRILKTWDRVCS